MSAPRIRTPGQLKVPELKEELRKRGITPKGLKKDLVEKLEEVLRNEGQEHIDNSPDCNLHQLAPVGPTSPQEDYRPLPLADSGTYSYDSSQSVSAGYTSSLPISTNNNSPPPDVDSGTPCYTPQPYLSDLPPQGSDTKDMHFNSPLQVADLRTHGDFGRKSAEGDASEWKSSAANVHDTASMGIPSASEPASPEDVIQKGEHRHQFDFTTKGPSGLVHGFPSAYDDKKEDAFCADDSVITDTVDKKNESGVDGSEPKVLGVAVCHEMQPTDNKAEVSPAKALLRDERNIGSHLSGNVVEKRSNIVSPVSDQCITLGPLSDGFEVEAKINSEKAEAVHITDDSADYSHPQRMDEQKSEEQEDKGNSLIAQRDNIFKLNMIGPVSAEKTSCNVITVPEEPMEHEAVQTNRKVIRVPEEHKECEAAGTNCKVTTVPEEPMEHEAVQNQSINTHLNALEFKYEPKDSCQESGSAHLGSGECSVTEVLTESEDVYVQCRALGPFSDGFESEAKINSEKAEVVLITEDNADYSQPQTMKEHKSEEQEDKGNTLTTERDNVFKLNKIGPGSAERANCKVTAVAEEPMEHEAVQTNCKVITVPAEPIEHEAAQTICKLITVPEEPMEHEAVQTNFKATPVPEEPMEQEAVQNQSINTHLDAPELKYEPRDSCQESGAAHLERNIMEYAPSVRADKKECINDENNRDKMLKLSETDPKFDYKQMFNTNSVREHTETEYMQNQYISLSPPVNVFESKPKVNLEELEVDQLKHNTGICYHDMGSSGQESKEAEIKEHAPASQSDQTFKLNKTNLNLADQQTANEFVLGAENVQSQYISCSTSKEVKSEHRTNSQLLEAAQCKQNIASADYSMGESEPNSEEQEDKGNALQIQLDEVSISTVSNTLLEEKQQYKRMPDNKEKVNPVVRKSHQSSFNLNPNVFELMPRRSNFKELEAEGPQQKGEEYHQPIQTVGDHEPNGQVKEGTPLASHREEVLQSCETDPSMAEKENHEVIPLPEVSMKPEDLQNKSTIHSSVSYELKSVPRANLEDIEDEHDHPTRMGKQENEGQKNSANESIMEGVSCSWESLPDEWKEKSQLTMSQSEMDFAREGLERPKTVKLSNAKIEEMVPMDVDSEVQIGRKQKDQDGEARQEPAKRQRRWNSGKNLLSEASNTKPLTTDTLKDIIPEKAVEIHLGSSSLESPVSPLATKGSHFLSKAARTSFSRPAPPPLKSDSMANGENKRPRIVPPPVRSPTISLKIERFLRPFTIKALKELLSETGTIRYFWIDQIKTHCYVTYSSVEEATATRNALYNLKWPIIGGRLLIAEFVDPEEVKLVCEGQSANVINAPNPMPHKNSTQGSPSLSLQSSSAQSLPPPPQSAAKTKQTLASDREPEPAIYTLDDLFKKTRAKPHIYYLPLTEEQVTSKLAAKGRDQQNQKVSHL